MNSASTSNSLNQKSSLSYRPDIDGLRALAILTVIGYHAFPNYISGGFIGVDIFFVISGYLIAKIIFNEMISGSFSFVHFYARRIKRIFPALILVISITFIIGWIFLSPRQLHSLGTNIAGSSLFLQNFVLLNQIGYFDIEAAKKPLLHLWSLGIEEQYYIFWPIILIFILRWKQHIITIISCIATLSFLVGYVMIKKHNSSLAFYLPFTRCWELLLGAATGIGMMTSKKKNHLEFEIVSLKRLTLDNVYAILGIALIAYALCHYTSHLHYPGFYGLVPVIATILLIFSSNSWINQKLLSCKLMIAVGIISYPLYLWHYPLIAYTKILFPENLSSILMINTIILSFFLAGITYYFIEKPIRFRKEYIKTSLILLILMGIIGLLGFDTILNHGFKNRVPAQIQKFMLTGEETTRFWRSGSCLLLPEQDASSFSKNCIDVKKHPSWFIWGDSYAAALYAGLNDLNNASKYSLSQFTASSCAPMLNYVKKDRIYCKSINDFVLQQVSIIKPDVIILHSTWEYDKLSMENGLRRTVTALRSLNIKKIILIGPVPTWIGGGLSDNVLDYYFVNSHQLLPQRTYYRSNFKSDNNTNIFLKKLANNLNIQYIEPLAILCNQNGCLARIGKEESELTAFDKGHLTLFGSKYLAEKILPQLLKM